MISHLRFVDNCYLFLRATEVEATTVKNVLGRYERLFGKSVNFKKSNICFGPNTKVEDREKVCTRPGVPQTSQVGKYLGMPMYGGKNKKGVFGFL